MILIAGAVCDGVASGRCGYGEERPRGFDEDCQDCGRLLENHQIAELVAGQSPGRRPYPGGGARQDSCPMSYAAIACLS